ncbi:hypothetical protein [Mycolicibacterium elephantis]|uniref:hypothetical protein n=1 Tax=Mycolicibacterium elephantis TaxID=81858 RepID=UPI000A4A8DF6|nr:hypothetical protein [Mycolicibacterium elephantis]
MREVRAVNLASAAVVASGVALGSVSAATPAQASDFGVELNGTYRVMSDGEWARTNEVLIDQETVIETWTVSTDCVSPIECTGTVVSDRGWTGTARLDDFWYVDHEIPNWVPCPDGTFAPGHQKFILWGVNPANNERQTTNMTIFGGRNQTKAPSGACGVNKPVVIELPVRAEKIS